MIWLPVFTGALSGCGLFVRDPKIDVSDIALTSLSLDSLSLGVRLSVENPNLIGVTIKNLSFNVFYQDGDSWRYLTCGSEKDIAVKRGKNEIVIPVTLNNMKLMSALVFIVANGKITLRIKGTATLDLLGLSPKIPFVHVTTIPLEIPGS